MSFVATVECPHCGREHEIETYDFDGSDEMDIECENEDCSKEFEVIREWYPSYSAHEIKYTVCNKCGKELRVGYNTHNCEGETLCQQCMFHKYFAPVNKIRGDE